MIERDAARRFIPVSEGNGPRPSPDKEPGPARSEHQPEERSIFGLAAELKNLIRGDRMRRAKRA